ncbi:MAG: hypothetical protein PHF86_14540 [Candidatus Nanoarchaeia archaeon]|nr:hypothetical protein [Candidatus Nanoarchaeia archaeon]
MQVQFEELEFQNILSFGNSPTNIKIETGVSLIAGSNGQGKCVHKDTKINVEMDEIIYKKFINIINSHNGTG